MGGDCVCTVLSSLCVYFGFGGMGEVVVFVCFVLKGAGQF